MAQAEDELLDAVRGVELHHVPQDRPAADLDHQLGPQMRFLTDPGAVAPGEDHTLHPPPPTPQPAACVRSIVPKVRSAEGSRPVVERHERRSGGNPPGTERLLEEDV